MNQFLKLKGYVAISTSVNFSELSTWEYVYNNAEYNIKIERKNFKTYDECIADLLKEHERITQ